MEHLPVAVIELHRLLVAGGEHHVVRFSVGADGRLLQRHPLPQGLPLPPGRQGLGPQRQPAGEQEATGTASVFHRFFSR